jgi:hypothetical protein
MLKGTHKTQGMAAAFTFLEQYQKDEDVFLNLMKPGFHL